jgi:hypothetical protein
VTLNTPAATTASNAATSSYNLLEKLIQRQSKMLSASNASTTAVSA